RGEGCGGCRGGRRGEGRGGRCRGCGRGRCRERGGRRSREGRRSCRGGQEREGRIASLPCNRESKGPVRGSFFVRAGRDLWCVVGLDSRFGFLDDAFLATVKNSEIFSGI